MSCENPLFQINYSIKLLYLNLLFISCADISYLKTALPQNTDPEFYVYLQNLSARDVTLSAVPEGEVVFPKVPLLTVKGPLAVVQLLETPLLNLVNYARLKRNFN